MAKITSSISVINALGIIINPATEEKQDDIIAQSKYNLSDLDKDSDTKYFGFVDKDGKYYIMRLTSTTARYCKGDSGYTTAWTARNSQTYLHYYEIF